MDYFSILVGLATIIGLLFTVITFKGPKATNIQWTDSQSKRYKKLFFKFDSSIQDVELLSISVPGYRIHFGGWSAPDPLYAKDVLDVSPVSFDAILMSPETGLTLYCFPSDSPPERPFMTLSMQYKCFKWSRTYRLIR